MNRAEHKVLGFTNIVQSNIVKTAVTVGITIRYYPGTVDSSELEANVRTAIYKWIDDNSRLGNPVYTSALEQAAAVPGVVYATVTSPASDQVPSTGGDGSLPFRTVYTFTKDATNVAITMTAL